MSRVWSGLGAKTEEEANNHAKYGLDPKERFMFACLFVACHDERTRILLTMTTTMTMKETLNRFFAAVNNNNVDEALACCAPDISCTYPDPGTSLRTQYKQNKTKTILRQDLWDHDKISLSRTHTHTHTHTHMHTQVAIGRVMPGHGPS